MSVLIENHRYGLLSRSGKTNNNNNNNNNVSIFHVKLTDSAARAVGSFNNGQRISIPCSEESGPVRVFTFSLSNVARHNPHGSFDCIQQLSSGPVQELSCLGVIQKKVTVDATDDSYDKARQSLAQAEEETRSRGAIVIKHGGRYQGKRVKVRPPAAALASLSKPKANPPSQCLQRGGVRSNLRSGRSEGVRSNLRSGRSEGVGVRGRPLRERVSHLLGLRAYRRPELIVRLQRDGLTAAERHMLDSVLMEVGHLIVKENAFILKDSLYKELQKDWPGYTTGDQQLLKRILVRRLFQPQQSLLSVPAAQVSPLRDTPNSSPAHRAKASSPPPRYDPPLGRKLRVSHLSSATARQPCRAAPCSACPQDDEHAHTHSPHTLVHSLTNATTCTPRTEHTDRLEAPEAAADSTKTHREAPSPPAEARPAPPTPTEPDVRRRALKRKRIKHREQLWRGQKGMKTESCHDDAAELTERFLDSGLQVEANPSDFVSRYTVISSSEQRQTYKQDFNREYDEYRNLHARIDAVTRQFMELDAQLKQLHHDSHKYKTVRNQILQEYRQIKKSNPNYSQDKIHCEYLHNKLAHIKRTISEYDLQQLQAQRSASSH